MSTTTAATPSLSKRVRQIMRKHNQLDAQIRAVADMLESDAELRTKYVERTWSALASDMVQVQRHHLRQLPSESYLEKHREAMKAAGKRLGLFSDYFVGDKALGDCTAADLEDAAFKHERNAKGMLREAEFFRKLAAKCGTKTVRKAWKESDAEKMKRELEDAGTL